VLVNEYELQRAAENESYFTIYPEYRREELKTPVNWPLGSEYTSANTRQLTTCEEVSAVLDEMGQVETLS
jgi:hypothetical protein